MSEVCPFLTGPAYVLYIQALFRGYQTTLTLAAKAHKVAMWTAYRVAGTDPETRETDITLDLPGSLYKYSKI